jgi:thiosulfate/3-mercaptopyruvate sulfurtransferase
MNPQIHWLKNRCVSLEKSLGPVTSRFRAVSLAAAVVILFAASAGLVPVPAIRGQEKRLPDPWTAAQTVQPADLARELGDKNGTPPTIVYVGFHTLFAGGHIPGATFHGSASTEQGLSDLKKWAEELPRTANLVIYCGCCPLEKCPNIRPAFTALDTMGFKRLRVLVLPTSFATDWADKGYPIQKGI